MRRYSQNEMILTEAAGQDFNSALEEFIKMSQGIIDRNYEKNLQNTPEDLKVFLVTTQGKKYVKIISTDKAKSTRSAWAFVDKETGNVFKPAGWNTPAKHARANIYDKNTFKNIGPYGPAYLK